MFKVGAYVYGYLVIASVAAFLYSDGNQPVRTADRILTLAYTGARRLGGAGIWPLIVYFALCSGVFYSGVNGHDSTDTCTGIGYPAS